MEKLKNGHNTGLIAPSIKPTDFIAGGESTISFENRLSTGRWKQYVSTHERQSTSAYDTMSCVTFSALNSVESQLNFLKETGQIPAWVLEKCQNYGYLNAQGKFDFSDWFSAIMSGTTKAGNQLTNVWDSFQKHGLLPSSLGKQPTDFTDIDGWLNRDNITSAQKTNALLALELFDIRYEWVLLGEPDQETLAYHLKHAPLHVATPTCGSWNSPEGVIVTPCGDYKRLNHATAIIGIDEAKAHEDLDHYNPFIKRLSQDYYIPYAIKGVVTIKSAPTAPVKPKVKLGINMSRGAEGPAVSALQDVLIFEGFLKKGLNTGYFGDRTFQAVVLFQEAHAKEILFPVGLKQGTGVVGSSTRAYINAVYA